MIWPVIRIFIPGKSKNALRRPSRGASGWMKSRGRLSRNGPQSRDSVQALDTLWTRLF